MLKLHIQAWQHTPVIWVTEWGGSQVLAQIAQFRDLEDPA